MRQQHDVTQFEYVLWRHTMHEWAMDIHYKTWIAQKAIHKHYPHPLKQWDACDNHIESKPIVMKQQTMKLLSSDIIHSLFIFKLQK